MQSYQRSQTPCQTGRDAISDESSLCSYQISIGKDNGDNSSLQFHLYSPYLICC